MFAKGNVSSVVFSLLNNTPSIDVNVVFPASTLISFRALQAPYLQPIITQYFIDNKSEIWLLFLIAHSKR